MMYGFHSVLWLYILCSYYKLFALEHAEEIDERDVFVQIPAIHNIICYHPYSVMLIDFFTYCKYSVR